MADTTSSSRRRDAERTKAAILAAAIAEFSANGAAGTRVDEVATRAGVNKSLIYQYFGSKQELYAEALISVFNTAADRARALAETCLADTTLHEMQAVVERFLTLHLRMLDELPEYPRLLAWENLDGGKTLSRQPVKRCFLRLQEGFAGAMRTFEQRGMTSSKVDARLGLLSVMALAHFYINYRALAIELMGPEARDEAAVRGLWITYCSDLLTAKAARHTQH